MENISLELIANIVGFVGAAIAFSSTMMPQPTRLQRGLALIAIVIGIALFSSPFWIEKIKPSYNIDWWFLGAIVSTGWGIIAYFKRERMANQAKEV